MAVGNYKKKQGSNRAEGSTEEAPGPQHCGRGEKAKKKACLKSRLRGEGGGKKVEREKRKKICRAGGRKRGVTAGSEMTTGETAAAKLGTRANNEKERKSGEERK